VQLADRYSPSSWATRRGLSSWPTGSRSADGGGSVQVGDELAVDLHPPSRHVLGDPLGGQSGGVSWSRTVRVVGAARRSRGDGAGGHRHLL